MSSTDVDEGNRVSAGAPMVSTDLPPVDGSAAAVAPPVAGGLCEWIPRWGNRPPMIGVLQ